MRRAVLFLVACAVPAAAAAQNPPNQTTPTTAVPAATAPQPGPQEARSSGWPDWLKVAFQYRGRVEERRVKILNPDAYEGFYLNRLRLGLTLDAKPWLQFAVQVQDSRVLAVETPPALQSLVDSADVRIANVAVGDPKGPAVVRAGRQELTLGEGRLIASPDWANINRTYDIGRATFARPGVKVDAFAGAPVAVTKGDFDSRKPGENCYGIYASLDKVLPGIVEPFFVIKTNKTAVSERAVTGRADLYTAGGRLVARVAAGSEVALDLVTQWGDIAGDSVSAWAAHTAFIRTAAAAAWKPKFTVEYNFASGDEDPKDGRRNTFDQLYASNHARYGLADAVGWRNMHHGGLTVETNPSRTLRLTAAAHRYFLASLGDGLYNASGVRAVYARGATSRDVGWETDLWALYTFSRRLSVGAGVAALFSGPYLDQAGSPRSDVSAYLTWTLRLP